MSLKAAKLEELREKLAPKRRDVFSHTGFQGGIPRGAITEVSGPHGGGKTEFVLKLIAENPRVHVAWVEDKLTAYPRAFPQFGVALTRVLFAEAEDQTVWTAHQMLRSGIFGIVVVSTDQVADPDRNITLRRLQLAAEQSHASLVLLSETPTLEGAWPINTQLAVCRGGQLRRLK